MFTYDEVKALTKTAEYAKLFKKKVYWKRAKGVVILADFKLGGKKTTIAIPYKKSNDAKKEYKKTIKGDGFPGLPVKQKMFVGAFKLETGADGTEKVVVKQLDGGASAEIINKKAGSLFEKIGWNFEVMDPNASPEAEATAPTSEVAAPTSEATESTGGDLAQLANQAKMTMQQIKNVFVPKFRANELIAGDQSSLEEAKQVIEGFKAAYEAAGAAAPAPAAAIFKHVDKMLAAVGKMLEKLGGGTSTSNDNAGNELVEMVRSIKMGMDQVKQVVVPNLRAQSSMPEDLQTVEALIQQINDFENQYQAAGPAAQQPVAQHRDKLMEMLQKLKTIQQRLETFLQSNSTGTSGGNLNQMNQNRERIEQIRNRINEIREALAA